MPSFYEFFAGGGMARAGFGKGWQCLFANDIDPKKAASYAANWGQENLKIGDVGGLTASELPGHADLAWASFPCQDLSLAGDYAGLDGDRSGTFWSFWHHRVLPFQKSPLDQESFVPLLCSPALCRGLG